MAGRSSERLAVIGGGQAAAQIIEVARQEGFTGPISLVCEEAILPYQRPPLSKVFLLGQKPVDWLLYRPESFYPQHGVDLHLGRRVEAIDRAGGQLRFAGGGGIGYDRLAIATGARAAMLDVPGGDNPSVFYIRTLADVVGLQARLGAARRIVIIGGGFIGLEAAAILVQQGRAVTLLASGERLIPRVLTAYMAEFLRKVHADHGVDIRTGAMVGDIRAEADGSVTALCTDGGAYPADIVIAGIGARPNVELADEAGLTCDNGIVVDEYATTSDPAIVAAGDCTNHPSRHVGGRLRLETVHNAVEQGRTAGMTIAGKAEAYDQAPWVWSDQYHLRLQSVGLPMNATREVIRGDAATGAFSAFYFRGEDFIAVNTVNQPLIFGACRRILNGGFAIDPDQAADPAFDIRAFARKRAPMEFDRPWPKRWEKPGAAIDWGHA